METMNETNIIQTKEGFKSYYVVWKPLYPRKKDQEQCLNRTM